MTIMVLVVGSWLLLGGVVCIAFPRVIFNLINSFAFRPLTRFERVYLIFYRVMGVIFVLAALGLFKLWFFEPHR